MYSTQAKCIPTIVQANNRVQLKTENLIDISYLHLLGSTRWSSRALNLEDHFFEHSRLSFTGP